VEIISSFSLPLQSLDLIPGNGFWVVLKNGWLARDLVQLKQRVTVLRFNFQPTAIDNAIDEET
jgi:hypothetical protein